MKQVLSFLLSLVLMVGISFLAVSVEGVSLRKRPSLARK